jgi:hypothetical protein
VASDSNETPEFRARKLLSEHLDAEQRTDLSTWGGFRVRTPEHMYWVPIGGNPRRVERLTQRLETLCVHPDRMEMPASDVALTHLLWLRASPHLHTERANVTRSKSLRGWTEEQLLRALIDPPSVLPPRRQTRPQPYVSTIAPLPYRNFTWAVQEPPRLIERPVIPPEQWAEIKARIRALRERPVAEYRPARRQVGRREAAPPLPADVVQRLHDVRFRIRRARLADHFGDDVFPSEVIDGIALRSLRPTG